VNRRDTWTLTGVATCWSMLARSFNCWSNLRAR